MAPASPELLTAPIGYAWASIVLVVLLVLLVAAIAIGKRRRPGPPRHLRSHPPSSDERMAMVMLWIFVAGVLAWLLHPLLPVRPWRLIVVRDLAYHFGIPGSLVLFVAMAAIRWLEHPRFPSALRPHFNSWKLALAAALLLGVMAWSTAIAVEDAMDLASAPVIAQGRLVSARRAYRSREGSFVLDDTGPLVLAHGTAARLRPGSSYRVAFTPHRRLVLSVRAVPLP